MKKGKCKIPESIRSVIISSFALIISVISIYFSRFEVVHDLYFTYSLNSNIYYESNETEKQINDFGDFLIFQNKGNQDEVVLNVYIVFALDDPYQVPVGIEPIIISAKKSAIINIPH